MDDKQIDNNVLIMLLSSIGLITLPHAAHIPFPLFLFFALLLTWRFLAVRYRFLLPNQAVLFVFTLIAVLLLYLQHQGIWGRDAGTALFMTALGLKLLEIKRQRDLYLTIDLAFFVAATQFLYLQNILMAGYILLVSCLLLCTMVFINSQQPRITASLKISATIIFQAIPLMIVAFIFFPRIEAPRWALYEDDNRALSGLNDTLEPGALTRLALSDQLAFRVTFDGEPPPPEQRYWRGPVLSHTDGKRWTIAEMSKYGQAPAQPEFYGAAYRYKLLLEPQIHNWVYALDMPAEFGPPLSQKSGYYLITGGKPDERAEYELISYPAFNTGSLDQELERINLQLPDEPSPRISALVATLGGFDGPPERFIDNLLNYFAEQHFYYTLDPPLYPERPIESFLFGARAGFCSHYAAAFVYLMRVAHIPARVVSGYQGGELNSAGNFMEIRQYNAHAWSEIWLAEKGWIRVDPTTALAPERVAMDINIERQRATGEVSFSPPEIHHNLDWLQHAKTIWRHADYSWQRWIVNYRGGKQKAFLSSFGVDNITRWVVGFAGLLGGVIALLSLMLLRQHRKSADPALRLYNKFCRKFAKKGLHRNPGEGANDFALRARARFPEQRERIDDITALYVKIRYGRNAAPEDMQQLKKQVDAC